MQQQQNINALDDYDEELVEEEEEEEYHPSVQSASSRPPSKRSKAVRLVTYAITVDLPDLRLKADVFCHVINGERYFFLKSLEKFSGCVHKTVNKYKEQNIEVVLTRDLVPNNINRLLMNLANIKLFLIECTKWASADCGRIITQLTNNPPLLKSEKKKQPRRDRPHQEEAPVTHEYLANFLEEMRDLVERAVANIGPATMVLYKRSPEFQTRAQEEVTARADELLPAVIQKVETMIKTNLERSINKETAKKYKEEKQKELATKIRQLDPITELRAMKSVLTSADYENDDDEMPIDIDKIADDIYPSKKKRARSHGFSPMDEDSQ